MITHSAEGSREIPEWPDFITFIDDVIFPLVLWVSCLALCFGPMIYFLFSLHQMVLAVLLGALGAFYFPICILSACMHNGISNIFNFHILVPSILRIGKDYYAVTALMYLVVVLSFFIPVLFSWLPFFGKMISRFLSYYLMVSLANMIGLMYFKHENKLDWF